MESPIKIFELYSKKNNLICDDVFNDIIMKYLDKKYCKKCHLWIGEHKISVCFLKNCAYCFYCRHKNIYPK